ncbi:sugar phosphate isomerase/epimerase [archaeon]|nr:sugar phosphate isomerase/epimerase [archaeon]
MVEFTDYWHAMDKKPLEYIDITTKELGVSAKMGDVLQGLKADITAGASHVELGFMGKGKGSLGQGNTTPEMFGTDKRQEIRQLAKLNDVTVSTHASLAVAGLAGFDPEHGRFSDSAKREAIKEIERTIDFAADAASGGAVVVHTHEFQRPVSAVEEGRFAEAKIEKEEMAVLAEKDTQKLVGVSRGKTIVLPKLEGLEASAWKPEKERERTEKLNIIEKYIGGGSELAKIPVKSKEGKPDEVEFVEIQWADVKEAVNKWNEKHLDEKEKDADKEFFLMEHRAELERARPFAKHYFQGYEGNRKMAEECEKDMKFWAELEKKTPKENMDILKADFLSQIKAKEMPIALRKDEKPSEALVRAKEEFERRAQAEKEGWVGYFKQIEEINRMQDRITPIKEVGVNRSAESYAEAAMYAYRVEKEKEKKGQKLDRPIFIAPENVFPEGGYGSHPDELKELIKRSREDMAKKLVEREKISKGEAERIAKEHIKATFDIGHAYTWKRFFPEKPEESLEEHDKRFKDWLMGKVKELAKEEIIGHVHLSDNFGYHDEHLAPGVGSAPIEEFVQELKKQGFKQPMIVEWGAQTDQEAYGAMLGAWARIASSPVYRVDSIRQSWSDIEHGYFGRTSSPKFMTYSVPPLREQKDWQAFTYSEASID